MDIVEHIAGQLKEPNSEQITRVVAAIGSEAALTLLERTLALEAAEGMLTRNGQRRTPGGVFFKLVEETVTPEQWLAIRHGGLYAWDDRLADLEQFTKRDVGQGQVRVEVTGTLPRVQRRHGVVVGLLAAPPPPVATVLPRPPRGYVAVLLPEWLWDRFGRIGVPVLIRGCAIADPELDGVLVVLGDHVQVYREKREA